MLTPSNSVQLQADAVVSSVRRNGLLVFVPEFNTKAPIFLSDDGSAFDTVESFDPKAQTLLLTEY